MEFISLKKIWFRYESLEPESTPRWVLRDFSLRLEEHERVVILGPNGCGKTTLIKILGGYLWPSRGTAPIVCGVTFGQADLRELRCRIGVVSPFLQERLYYDSLVEEVLLSGRDASIGPVTESLTSLDKKRLASLLRQFNLLRLRLQPFGSLSSGQKIRVLMARAFWNHPVLLLLDEPVAHLDPVNRGKILAQLKNLGGNNPPAQLLVTQNRADIPKGFKRVILLRAGRKVFDGNARQGLTRKKLAEAFGTG